ncbi:MAG TPA: PIN domain-containing protein [Acidobacteriaceae bacterium]|nr:PIN domain-containing protein [Acidobacteriaceae bacterium]
MSDRLLFDTNSLLWFGNGVLIRPAAAAAILLSQQTDHLRASAISVWELTFASRKRHPPSRPDLRGMTSRQWFDDAIRRLRVSVIAIDTDIASEAAEIAPSYGSGDPGDCILIATAHLQDLTLITRDARILSFAKANPEYMFVIPC